ncbi:MAG: sugar phosphate isomerase/epimerase [Thermoguttaceae bacterium]
MSLSRREMLKLGACTAAAWAGRLSPLAAEPTTAKKIPIALQLYSLRTDCAKDLPGMLAAVGKMGYQGVEFAGYHGRTAEQLRSMLDDNGLKCCGTHTGIDTLLGDRLAQTIEFNRTLGNKFLIVPWLPQQYFASIQAVKDTAKLLTGLAAKVKPQGMRVGYHSHGGDFAKIEGQNHWDLLFESAGPEVVMQLDVGNCLDGGGDPVAELKKFPGRCATIHIKEHGGKPGASLGEGTVDWKEIFRICETTGGTQWYIVEQEAYSGSPLDCVRKCLENLRKMGK